VFRIRISLNTPGSFCISPEKKGRGMKPSEKNYDTKVIKNIISYLTHNMIGYILVLPEQFYFNLTVIITLFHINASIIMLQFI
jgi:hypothetical protein